MDTPPTGVVLDSKPLAAPPSGVVLDAAQPPAPAPEWNGVGLPPLGTGTPRNPRTGQIEHAVPAGSIPILDAPIVGIPQAVRGGRELATRGERERGAADVIEGGLNTASIALPAAAVEAPLGLALGLATGTAAARGTQVAAKELGASPDAARLAGDVGGVVAGGLTGKRFISPEEAGVPEGVAFDTEPAAEPPVGVALDPEPGATVQPGDGTAKPERVKTPASRPVPSGAYVAAREKLASRLAAPSTQLDPAAQANAGRVGLFHFQNGSADYDTWAKSMVQDVGDGITPHLKEVWGQVQRRAAMDRLAGNINLDRLNTADDVKEAIRQTAAANPDALAAQTRGSTPLASTADAARQLVADGLIQEKDVANITKGTAWNAEQINAARGVMLSLQERARDAQMAWKAAPTDENLAGFRDAVARAGAVQQSVAGLTAEAGRALSSMRIMADAMRKRSGIEQALNTLGGRELNEQAARALASIPDGDSVGLAKFIRSQNQWTTPEKVQAYWTASLLSSPKTMAAKLVGDATMAALDAPVRVVRGVTDAAMAKIAGRPQQYFAGEALPSLAGWFHGLGGGFQDALQLLQHGYSATRAENVVGGVEAPRYELPFGGANPMNWGPRFLEATTEMMRAAGMRAEMEAGAYRVAKGEKLAGTALKSRMADILAQPTDELVNQAAEFAKKQTFTNNTPLLQRLTGALDFQTANGWRPLRFFVPFARVPYNIFARGLELTPAGLAAGLAKGDADLTARGLIGSMVLGTAAHWAANGNLTGAAPQDPRDRAAFYASGKQPYSVKVGDHWISYERNFGVLGMPMAAAAAFKARYDKQGNAPAPEEIQQAMGSLLHMFAALPFVTGINSVAQAMNDPQRFGSGLVSSLASAFVPFSAGLRVGAHTQDPSMRDARGVYQRILSGIPFAQESLPLRYDPMGRPDVARGNAGPLNAVLPSPVSSTAPVGAADAEAARLGEYPAPTERTVIIGNRRVQLTPQQAQAYQKAVGQAQLQATQNAMGQPGYWQQTDEQRRQQLHYAMAYARRAAEAQFRAQLAQASGR